MRTFESETGQRIYPVWWLPTNCYCLPSCCNIASTTALKQGHVTGIDAASLAAVYAMEVRPGDHVLDLCCAPGAKFNALAEAMNYTGTLTGVDISCKRLQGVVKVTRRLKTSERGAFQPNFRCRLIHGDGTSFCMPPPKVVNSAGFVVANMNEVTSFPTKREARKSKKRKLDGDRSCKNDCLLDSAVDNRWKNSDLSTKRSHDSGDHGMISESELYDRVLVDAECTHDGSQKHIEHFQEKKGQCYWSHVTESHVQTMANAQSNLLENGFKLLRENGTLIYSTCSLTEAQNEEVIRSFLDKTPSASLSSLCLEKFALSNWELFKASKYKSIDPPSSCIVHCPTSYDSVPSFPWKYSTLAGVENVKKSMARFEPSQSHTGGLFVCKVTKNS